ncbi:MAG TPA: cold shock domain-containing protein [Halobacteriales archaeon]|mgnify:CR=1 FL=1|jgi:CspA family cold shock protein|nr:cold shock domain-containing protein [Halobacteriales archaeon]|tara:strand:- start:6770 stop:7021 length:252 start_codon:yes stop_codon:yes gene_type:complete
MPTGTIVFFHSRKGYGFIKQEDSSTDVFVHMDDVDGPDLTEGEVVEFEIETAPKGPRATNVKRIAGDSAEAIEADDSESSETE